MFAIDEQITSKYGNWNNFSSEKKRTLTKTANNRCPWGRRGGSGRTCMCYFRRIENLTIDLHYIKCICAYTHEHTAEFKSHTFHPCVGCCSFSFNILCVNSPYSQRIWILYTTQYTHIVFEPLWLIQLAENNFTCMLMILIIILFKNKIVHTILNICYSTFNLVLFYFCFVLLNIHFVFAMEKFVLNAVRSTFCSFVPLI